MRKRSALFAVSSLILVFTLLISAGCVNNSAPDVIETTSSEATTESDVLQTEALSETQSELSEDDVTETAEETTTEAALPQTIPEIVDLFNKSVNRIKPEATKVVKNYENRIVDKSKLVVPKSLESTADTLIDTFMKDDTEPIVYSTREEIQNEYLVPNQSYVSKVKASDVEKAVCTDKGNEYVIYIKLKDEKNPVTGKGVGSVCDIIEASEVADKASFIKEFTTEYSDCDVEVTIDKATGRVTHSRYKTPLLLSVTVDMFGTHNAAVGLTFIKDYTITY